MPGRIDRKLRLPAGTNLCATTSPATIEHRRGPEAQEVDEPADRPQARQVEEGAAPDQRPEDDEEREAQHHHGADEDEADRIRAA